MTALISTYHVACHMLPWQLQFYQQYEATIRVPDMWSSSVVVGAVRRGSHKVKQLNPFSRILLSASFNEQFALLSSLNFLFFFSSALLCVALT